MNTVANSTGLLGLLVQLKETPASELYFNFQSLCLQVEAQLHSCWY